MVGMAVQDASLLPGRGDRVRVDWGLDTVLGRVLESYATGGRAKVLVEIDPGQVSEETTTLTVPLGAVEATDEAKSAWAARSRYEQGLARALSRVLGSSVMRVEREPELGEGRADLLLRLKDSEPLIIETTYPSSAPDTSLASSLQQLRQYVDRRKWYGMLVTQDPLPAGMTRSLGPRLSAAVWRHEADDECLRRAVLEALGRRIDD